MPSNRFDQATPQQYVSQYVKLPFETISALGEKANKNFEEGKKIEDDLGALGAVIKAAPVYEKHKQQFISEYNKKTQDLVDEAKGDYGSPEFKRKAHKLMQEFKSRPEIDAFAQTNKAFQDYQSEKKDAKNAMNLDWTYQKDKDGNYVQLDVNKQGVYSPKFTQYEDWNETAKKVMGHVASSGSNRDLDIDFSRPTTTLSNGETAVYSKKHQGYVGVSDPRIRQLAELGASEYANTVAGKHHLQSLVGEDIDYQTLSREAQNNPQAAKAKKAIDQEFINHMYRANANQIGGVTTDTQDYHYEHDRQAAAGNDKKKLVESLTPSSIEGKTFDATNADPQFKGLVDNGVFVKGSNGLIAFNMDALTKTTSTPTGYTTSYMGPGMGVVTTTSKQVTSTEKIKEFKEQLIKMSKAVGVNPKSLSKDNKLNNIEITKLVNDYNSITKSRVADLNLAPAAQAVESSNANLNWDYIKQVDPTNPTKTILNEPLQDNEVVVVVNRRTNKDGQMYTEGYIKNKDTGATVKPIAFRSNLREKNMIYDAVGKTQKLSIDNLSDQNPTYMKDSQGKDAVMNVNLGNGNKEFKTIGYEKIGQNKSIQTLVDPNNRKNVLYRIINEATGEVEVTRSSLTALKKDVDMYYYDTPEGNTELEAIKSHVKQAEDAQNAR